MMAEAEESYFGLEYAQIWFSPLASFSCYLGIELLKTRAFLTSAGLAGSEFTAYNKEAVRSHYPLIELKNLSYSVV